MTVQELVCLVRADDLSEVRRVLEAAPELADMTVSYGDEHRPIHFAVMNRSPEMVRLLMRHGAGARKGIHPYRDATTALTMARERAYGDIVAVIEEEEQRRGTGIPACVQDDLMEAIRQGDDTRALAMLEADPSLVRAANRDGWTPLHVAAAVLNPRLVNWLIDHGADVNRQGKQSLTPLDVAGRRSEEGGFAEGFANVAGMLRAHGAQLNARSAVALGEADWLRARHSEGTLVNPIEWSCGGLIAVAVRHDRADILSLLLDFGLDSDERVISTDSQDGATSQGFPLWHCAEHGKYELAEILLKRGANPNACVDSSGTPVFSAFSHRQWRIVDLLRRYGGVVPADTAAIYRQTDLVRQMIALEDHGALPQGTVSPGRTLAEDLLDFANSGGAPEVVAMALQRIDWPRDDKRWFFFLARSLDFWNHIPWLSGAHQDLDRTTYFQCFRLVLERCDPNLIGSFGRTIMHEVAAAGDHVTDEELESFATAALDAGAPLDRRDELLNSTPLGWACRWGRASLVKLLLARGADPIEADAEPWARPQAWAARSGIAFPDLPIPAAGAS